MSKGKWRRIEWTRAQINRMHELIDEGERTGKYVRWTRHVDELGHDAHSIRAKAFDLREERKRAKQARARVAANIAPPAPDRIEIDHRVTTTPIHALIFAADMRNRIGMQGITAGLLGDPLPGRSALDRKRAGLAGPELRRRGDPWLPKPVSLAAVPD